MNTTTHKRLLVLDLDETLIHSTPIPQPNQERIGMVVFYGTVYHVYKRPYLDLFLDFAFTYFEVGIWTAASRGYAEVVLPMIFNSKYKPLFIWTSNRITKQLKYEIESGGMDVQAPREDDYVKLKKLKKVRKRFGYAQGDILVVDDTPSTFSSNYGNGIRVSAYETPLGPDDELFELMMYLCDLLYVPNWHKIEKRGWRFL